MKKGEIVKYLTGGDWNAGYIFGIVIASGPKAFSVRWESGIVNRISQPGRQVEPVTDPALLAQLTQTLRGF